MLDVCRGARNYFHDRIDIGNTPQATSVFAVESGIACNCNIYFTG